MVGVGNLINCSDFYIFLDLVGVGDWKVPTIFFCVGDFINRGVINCR